MTLERNHEIDSFDSLSECSSLSSETDTIESIKNDKAVTFTPEQISIFKRLEEKDKTKTKNEIQNMKTKKKIENRKRKRNTKNANKIGKRKQKQKGKQIQKQNQK